MYPKHRKENQHNVEDIMKQTRTTDAEVRAALWLKQVNVGLICQLDFALQHLMAEGAVPMPQALSTRS